MQHEPQDWRRYFSPLDVAAYVTWAAIAIEVWFVSPEFEPVGGLGGRALAMSLMSIFLAAFLGCASRVPADGRRPPHAGLALMAASVLALLWLGRAGTTPVLLILLAATLVFAYPPRIAAALLVAVNVAFVAIIALRWRAEGWWLMAMVYGGFQAFAVFTARAVRRADAAVAELQSVNAHLLATRSLLAEAARDGERLRLSRELHDLTGHKLTALKLNLAALARDPAIAERRELAVSRQVADELLADVRTVVSQLRRYDGLDLREAFAKLAEPFPRPAVHISVADDARVADAAMAEALVRAAQEGLTNAVRHARAQNVWLALERRPDGLSLTIEDDGNFAEPTPVAGHGLTGMRERLEALGGSLEAGRGTHGGLRLLARLPAAVMT